MSHIFGYSFDQIKAAQQGKKWRETIDVSKPIDHALMPGDIELLNKHGEDKLYAMGFYGVIDRLSRNGII